MESLCEIINIYIAQRVMIEGNISERYNNIATEQNQHFARNCRCLRFAFRKSLFPLKNGVKMPLRASIFTCIIKEKTRETVYGNQSAEIFS